MKVGLIEVLSACFVSCHDSVYHTLSLWVYLKQSEQKCWYSDSTLLQSALHTTICNVSSFFFFFWTCNSRCSSLHCFACVPSPTVTFEGCHASKWNARCDVTVRGHYLQCCCGTLLRFLFQMSKYCECPWEPKDGNILVACSSWWHVWPRAFFFSPSLPPQFFHLRPIVFGVDV